MGRLNDYELIARKTVGLSDLTTGLVFFTYNHVHNNIIGGGMTEMKEEKAGWKHKLFLEMTAYS